MSAEYKPGTVLLSWLFSIVDSVYIDMVRYEARRNTFSLEHVENFAARSDVDSRIGMIDLSRLITKLPPHMQEILTVPGLYSADIRRAFSQAAWQRSSASTLFPVRLRAK